MLIGPLALDGVLSGMSICDAVHSEWECFVLRMCLSESLSGKVWCEAGFYVATG